MFCRKCGESLPESAVFCNKCGEKVNTQKTAAYNQTRPAKPVGLIIVAVVMAVFAISMVVVGIILVLSVSSFRDVTVTESVLIDTPEIEANDQEANDLRMRISNLQIKNANNGDITQKLIISDHLTRASEMLGAGQLDDVRIIVERCEAFVINPAAPDTTAAPETPAPATPAPVTPAPATPSPQRLPSVPGNRIENEVNRIRTLWEAAVNGKANGSYSSHVVASGVTAYSDRGQVKMIEAARGVSHANYSGIYLYDDGRLIFAFLEGADAHRLYYYDSQLFRWRYSANASNPNNSVNYDNDFNSSEFLRWERFALDAASDLYSRALR